MGQTQDYIIHLDSFDGPLDVLLFLIQKSKMDIMDISISEITNQYIAYIKSLQELNLEVASEYILMSAQLIEMKSKMLLPKSKTEAENEEDPREALIKRLLEYKKYKEVVQVFKDFEFERQQVYSKPMSAIDDFVHDETLLTSENKRDVYQLVQAFENMLARQRLEQPHQVTLQKSELSIEDQIINLEQKLKAQGKIRMSSVIRNQSRGYIVTTFLAILQLIRMQQITVVQEELFEDIELEYTGKKMLEFDEIEGMEIDYE